MERGEAVASSVENIIKMIRILQNEACVSGQDLAFRLGVSVKTIQKYKQDLEKMHIFIETKKGRYGGYYLDNAVLELHSALTDEESKALVEARGHLERDRSYRQTIAYHSAVDKVIQNERMAHTIKNKSSISKISNTGFRGGFERIKLEKLQAAVREQKIVFIEFESENLGMEDALVHPYGLLQLDGRIVLIAFSEAAGDIQLFHVKDIRHLATTRHQFVPPETIEAVWVDSLLTKK